MADCKAYREEIEELAGVGRLSLEARAHVNACEACRQLEQERASLRRLVAGLGGAESGSGESNIAQATVKNTTAAPGPVPPGFKNAPRKAVSRATSPARVREVAQRGPAGGAGAEK